MSSATLRNAVRQYLASNYMFVDEEWLNGCVEYLSEDGDNNYSETDIKNLAKEQWLLNDLNLVCPGSLLPNLKNQQKTVLNGRYVLQINAAIDIDKGFPKDALCKANTILVSRLNQSYPAHNARVAHGHPHALRKKLCTGTPAYQQYLKLQKVNMENVEATTNFEEKISSHRMIKLHLTDGAQEIFAIEYKPMRNLSCDITPGCKILLKGPIECRRGTLLLTENAIELLGGEVQELAISNSLAGLLSTKLGVTCTQGPDSNATVNQPRHTNNIPTPHIDTPPYSNHTFEPMLDPTDTHPTSIVDDDIDLDQIAALEAQLMDNGGKRSLDSKLSNPEKKIKIDTVNNPDDYPDENDLILQEEDEDYLREIEAKIDEKYTEPKLSVDKDPICVPAEPFVYIKQLQNLSDSDKGRVFKVKGQIMTLLSKLSVGKDEWSLKCTIVDGTGRLDVEFTSDVLSKLVGITPQEMNVMKKQMATKPELKEKAFLAIKQARDKLQVMYCIIEITMSDVPKITDFTTYDCEHVESLKRRLPNGYL